MVNSKILVRPAVLSDAEEILVIERSVARDGLIWGYGPSTKEEIGSRIGPLTFVAVAKGQLVGHIHGIVRKPGTKCVFRKGERYVSLDAVCVCRGWRGRGVGALLVRRLIREARKEGYHRFLVSTANKEMERVIRFYRGLGFHTWYAGLFI